ncbi:Hypp1976 [Branchiostoma lanceolatum]|uniref:Hypp1976 protein n=1 Tax=Branchiostoma lanceolatum TaxID=7740 RepID=A0A8J9ZQF3_BRALA|nr:Hypp1976 [Branchiostoma lanceolatum]
MDASAEAVVDIPVISNNSDIDTVLHGKAQREQDVICKVSSPISSFLKSKAEKPLNTKPILLLKKENRLDATPCETEKPVLAKVIPVKKIVLVKKKSRTENTDAEEVQQSDVKKLEDLIALACPFCEKRPEDKTILKNHLKTTHNMNIVEECKLAQPFKFSSTTANPDQQDQKLWGEETVAEDVLEDPKTTCTRQTLVSEAQTKENQLCSGASEGEFKKGETDLQKELTAANNSEESKVGDDKGQEKTEDDHVENECSEAESPSSADTNVVRMAYSLSQLMPLKEEPDWGMRRKPREPPILDVSLPIKKETDKNVKVSRKCTKRKKKEAKGNKEEVKRVAKGKRRKVEERLDGGSIEVNVERSEAVRKVAVKKTSTTTKKSSSSCYKHKKKFMPANETTLKEWEHLLKASYTCNQYPSREEIQRLAMETGQEFALIRTWFAYERQNQKLGPRPRNVYYKQSTDHTAYMEEELQKNPKPTLQDMSRIADKTGLSLGLVIYWFKKRLSLAGLNLEEHALEARASAHPVSSSSKDQKEEESVQLKVPKLDSGELHCRKSSQSRRKGIPKKRETKEDQKGEPNTELKEGDQAVNNKPKQDSDCVKDMTDFDASSVEETGDGKVQQKLQRRPIDELVSKVAARVMSDKDSVESILGTDDSTVHFDNEDTEEQAEEHDQLDEMQSFVDEMSHKTSFPQAEKVHVGQQSSKKPEKVKVKSVVTPINLKVQRKSIVKMVKHQQAPHKEIKPPDKLEATAFTQYRALTQHLREKHNIQSRFEHRFTIKKFPNVKTNTQEKYQCQYCPIYYHMPGFLVKHLRDQHGVKDQIVKGSAHFEIVKPEIMEKMGSGKVVKTGVHPNSSHGQTVTQYCCALCPKSATKDHKTRYAFLQFKTLEDHLMTSHNVTSDFDKYCTSQQVPVLEISKHDVITYAKHRCKLCNAQYNYMGFIVRHLNEKHDLKDLDMKWSDFVEVVTPEMKSFTQDSVQRDQSWKLFGQVGTKANSEQQLVQEQHPRSTSAAKPAAQGMMGHPFTTDMRSAGLVTSSDAQKASDAMGGCIGTHHDRSSVTNDTENSSPAKL